MRIGGLALVAGLVLTAAGVARADRLKLTDGGQVEGCILQEDGASVQIQTSAGLLEIPRKRIQEIIYEPSAREQYEQVKALYRDTAEDHFRLSQWCQQHHLHKERRVHLQRAIELDPNHEAARKALGFLRVGDQWVTLAEKMKMDGYVQHKGKWMLPEERDVAVQKEARQARQQEWGMKIRTILAAYKKGRGDDPVREARAHLSPIADPDAVEPLVALLGRENATVRRLLAETLGQIDSPAAVAELVKLSVLDDDIDVRLTAVDSLRRMGRPQTAALYGPYLKARAGDRMRRAALAVGQLGDLSVVPVLIDLLVTREKVVRNVPVAGGLSLGSRTDVVRGFRPAEGSGQVRLVPKVRSTEESVGVGAAGVRQKVELVERRNLEVLEALTKLTGRDFGFDVIAWKTWWGNRNPPPAPGPPAGQAP